MTEFPTLLVVDDEVLLLRSIVRMLSLEYRVLTFDSGGAALAYLGAGGACAAIVCDVRMGDMAAMVFHERLRGCRPELERRTIFMTGSDDTATSAGFLMEHRERVLLKPFGREEALALLSRVIDEEPGRASDPSPGRGTGP